MWNSFTFLELFTPPLASKLKHFTPRGVLSRPVPFFCNHTLFSACNLLQSQQHLSCSLVFLCVFVVFPVLDWEWWGGKRRGGCSDEDRASEHDSMCVCVCVCRWPNAPAKLLSLLLVMCGETRHEYQISLELRKGGQAEHGNRSCCLARNCRIWSRALFWSLLLPLPPSPPLMVLAIRSPKPTDMTLQQLLL